MEKEEKKKFLIAQRILLFDPEKKVFLLSKIKDSDGPFAKRYGIWDLAGGRLEENEMLDESLNREIKEELGDINFKPESLLGAFLGKYRVSDVVFLLYLSKYLGGEIQLSDEHSEYKWETAESIISSKEYKDWIKDYVKKAVEYLEKEKYLDSWKRCQADFENYKKAQVAHQEEFRKYAKMDVIEQILPVLDNFEASLAHVPDEKQANKWVEGIVYIKKQIEDILKNNDIEEIEVKPGIKFNPELHEAIAGKGEKVKKVIQKGYRLNGRILRAARVELG